MGPGGGINGVTSDGGDGTIVADGIKVGDEREDEFCDRFWLRNWKGKVCSSNLTCLEV